MTAQTVELVVACVEAVWPLAQQAPGPWLSAGESLRLARIADRGRAREFVASRCLLRLLLSAHTGYDRGWWHWELEAPENATPVVQACGVHGAALHLNLSHSQGLLACALSPRPVGVDLEVQRSRRRDLDGLADLVCSPQERAHLAGLPDDAARQSAFLQIWTLKEAYFKWLGTGLEIARLSALCSHSARLEAGAQPAHCAGWSSAWAGRSYALSVCTGALPVQARHVVIEGLHCLAPAAASASTLVAQAALSNVR